MAAIDKARERAVLAGSEIFSGLPEQLIDRIESIAARRVLRPGQTLMLEGDPSDSFYVVVGGHLKVFRTSAEGGEQLIAIISAGEVVGELGVFDGRPRSASVSTVTESVLYAFAKERFEALADAHPALYRHLLAIVAKRLRLANQLRATRTFRPLTGRVAEALLRLAEAFGKPLPDGRLLVQYKITQSDLAAMTDAARENVSRVLNDWRRKRHVSRISRYYCIEDIATLKRLAGDWAGGEGAR